MWAALLAGPVVVWVVGATMPQKTFSGQARSLRMGQIANAAVWGAVIWAIVWSLTGRVTGNWLWGMYIIYHWLLLLIHFLGRCGRATRQRAPGLWRHNDLGPVFLTFTIEAALLVLCIL